MKDHNVATVDIPDKFIQLDMEGEDTFVNLECKMMDILSRLDRRYYSKYKTMENGKPVMYAKLKINSMVH